MSLAFARQLESSEKVSNNDFVAWRVVPASECRRCPVWRDPRVGFTWYDDANAFFIAQRKTKTANRFKYCSSEGTPPISWLFHLLHFLGLLLPLERRSRPVQTPYGEVEKARERAPGHIGNEKKTGNLIDGIEKDGCDDGRSQNKNQFKKALKMTLQN